MLEQLKILSELPGISGREDLVRRYLVKEIEKKGLDPTIDNMGNVTVHKKGNGKRILLCAHMDEKGLMAAGIRDDGLLSYRNNGLDPRMIVSKRVQIGEERVPGVIGSKPNHLQSPSERETVLNHDQLFIDIGAKNKASAAARVKVGDGIAFATKFGQIGNGQIKGKALESRTGCTILLDLLSETYDCDLFVTFTSMAHIGWRGIQAAAWRVQPQMVISIEGVETGEAPAEDDTIKRVRLGGGPVLCDLDSSGIFSRRLVETLSKASEGIVQHTVSRTGSDAGAAALTLTGCCAAAAAVPCRRMYTPCEMASVLDLQHMRQMLHTFLKERLYDEVKE